MLEIKHMNVYAADKKIIDDLSLTMKDGEIHAIMGPNGVGKSTICKAILKCPGYEIKQGTIFYDKQDLQKLSTTDISRLGIFYISQTPTAIEGVTNAEMLRLALSARTNEKIDIFTFTKKCNEICTKIGLPTSFLHRAINDGMSGGERKKNELLHLWLLEPKCIILDEIDSGLDVDALKTVASSIAEYYEEKKPSILIITHHTQILDIIKPDFVHILSSGKIVKTGTAQLAYQVEKEGFQNQLEDKGIK